MKIDGKMKIDEITKIVANQLGVDIKSLKIEETDTSFFFSTTVKNKFVCIEVIKETGMILPVPMD